MQVTASKIMAVGLCCGVSMSRISIYSILVDI